MQYKHVTYNFFDRPNIMKHVKGGFKSPLLKKLLLFSNL